jgi:hypothetical protein
MPARQGLRPHRQRTPAAARHDPTQRRQHRSVAQLELRPPHRVSAPHGLQSQRTAAAISFACPEPADRLVLDRLRHVELALLDHAGDHRGIDRSEADDVDADAALFERGALGEPEHAVLRGVVRSAARKPNESAERKAVDDGARPLHPHLSPLVLHARPRPRRLIASTRSKIPDGSSAASLGGIMIVVSCSAASDPAPACPASLPVPAYASRSPSPASVRRRREDTPS